MFYENTYQTSDLTPATTRCCTVEHCSSSLPINVAEMRPHFGTRLWSLFFRYRIDIVVKTVRYFRMIITRMPLQEKTMGCDETTQQRENATVPVSPEHRRQSKNMNTAGEQAHATPSRKKRACSTHVYAHTARRLAEFLKCPLRLLFFMFKRSPDFRRNL